MGECLRPITSEGYRSLANNAKLYDKQFYSWTTSLDFHELPRRHRAHFAKQGPGT
jgi:hypothetical protein